MSQEWCTIESDPGVFTELIETIGVEDVQVMEVYSLDADSLSKFQPVYGLVFLFKWVAETDSRSIDYNAPENLFFARQTIHNACATQAILSVILNNSDSINIGSELQHFKEFTLALDPEMRGDAIGNLENVRVAHNSFNRPNMFGFSDEKDKSGKAEDAFHFIAYIPFQGQVYELDGLKPGPINLGSYTDIKDWVSVVQPHITERIARYGEEIRFNLMCLTRNLGSVNKKLLEESESRIQQIRSVISQCGNNDDNNSMDVFDPVPTGDKEGFERLIASKTTGSLNRQLQFEIEKSEEYKHELQINEQLLESWKRENRRRRENYIPLVMELLRQMATKQVLTPAIDEAREKYKPPSQ